MKIWEDDNQKYIKAMMEKNTTEQNEKLTKRLEEIDFSVLEHIERKETVNERGVFAHTLKKSSDLIIHPVLFCESIDRHVLRSAFHRTDPHVLSLESPCNKKRDHRPFFSIQKIFQKFHLIRCETRICIQRKPSAVPDIIFRIPRQPDLFFRIQHIRSHSPRFSPALTTGKHERCNRRS